MVNGNELIGAIANLTLQVRCHTNQCCYNQVQLYILTVAHAKPIPILINFVYP
jgi:hypothetical protein